MGSFLYTAKVFINFRKFMLKYISLKFLKTLVFMLLVSALFPLSFAHAQDRIEDFSYTHLPTQNGILPYGSKWELRGTYGVNICPGDSGPIGYQIYYTDYTNTGRSLGGDHPSMNQPIDSVITLGPGTYQDLRILCLDSGTVMRLDDSFSVSSMPIIKTGSQLEPAYKGKVYSNTLEYRLSPGEHDSFPTPPYTWTVTNGSLPRGLSLDAHSGLISGKPTGVFSATSTFAVQIQDVFGKTDTKTFMLPVVGIPKLRLCAVSPRRTQIGVNYSKTIAIVGGGTGPYAWSVTGGALPIGLELDPDTGVVSGTPTRIGTSSVTIRVTDGSSQAVSKIFNFTIVPMSKYGDC
jgi:hypothetical protein